MALAITADTRAYAYPYGQWHTNPYKHTPLKIVPDSAYAANGESVRVSDSPIDARETIMGLVFWGGNAAAAGYKVAFDVANEKILILSTLAGELQNYAPGGGDIKGSANTDIGIASGTLPTNGALISTLAAANNTTTMTIAVSPDVPRNISISFKNTVAGASTGNAVTCVITGTFRGAAQTESISFTALELTSTAQNEVATKYGSKPFDTVTSVTNPVAQPTDWQHAVGVGSKLGLPTDLYTPIEADVTKITKNGADLSPSGIVDTTNMTVNLGTLADGADVSIQYRSAAAQVATGTDLSALIFYALATTWG